MQFSGNLRENPLFWANFGLRASPLGSKLCWPPDQNPGFTPEPSLFFPVEHKDLKCHCRKLCPADRQAQIQDSKTRILDIWDKSVEKLIPYRDCWTNVRFCSWPIFCKRFWVRNCKIWVKGVSLLDLLYRWVPLNSKYTEAYSVYKILSNFPNFKLSEPFSIVQIEVWFLFSFEISGNWLSRIRIKHVHFNRDPPVSVLIHLTYFLVWT